LRDKAATRVNDRNVLPPGSPDEKIHKRGVLALECAAVDSSAAIECKHFVHKPNDATGHSIAKVNDCFHHTYSLTGEAWQAVVFRMIEHTRELCGT